MAQRSRVSCILLWLFLGAAIHWGAGRGGRDGSVAAGLAMVVPPARPLPVRVQAPAGGGPVATLR